MHSQITIFKLTKKNTITEYSSSSSLSCHADNMDLPDSLLPPFSIVHHTRLVFQTTFCIGTELLYIGSSWSSYRCSSMWRGPQEYITYEFVLTSPVMFCMSVSSNLDSFREGWWVAVQLWGVASRTCSVWLAVFLCNRRHAFSPYVSVTSM